MLDLAYGLLDPVEAAALESHVDTCPACTAAKAAAAGDKALFARAARSTFPKVQFVPPGEGTIEPRRPSSRTQLLRWAVAAGILLAVAGTIGPTVQSKIRSAAMDNRARTAVARVKSAREDWTAAVAKNSREKQAVLESARKAYDSVVTEWVAAESTALQAKDFAVEVTGPASAVVGAPNDYRIRVADPFGQPVAAAVEVAVTDSTGKVRAGAKFDPAAAKNGTNFRLPASAWTGLPTGSGLTLAISATNPTTGQKSRLAEPINLLPPVYNTFLATDRPLYQPGETLFFRSVTLDRTRLLPPDRDLALRYVLLDPHGQIVPGLSLTGRSSPALMDKDRPVPVLGPDGKPVRGVGCGAFALPAELSAGEYTLVVYELPIDWTKVEVPTGTIPLAKRKVQIRKYVPTRIATKLEFGAASYAPGDRVTVKLTATAHGQPLANAQILTSVSADGKRISPVRAPFNLDPNGSATLEFTLPNDKALSQATVKVTILEGESEIVTKPVPLALKAIGLDFFPEGGDLIAGVAGRVYFRARTPDGQPVEFRGDLFVGNKAVATVTTVSDKDQPAANRGLGVFTFTPEAGKRYILRCPTGEFPLPKVKPDGVGLSIPDGVVGTDRPILVHLTAGKTQRAVVVGAYARGRPIATARVLLMPGKVTPVELQPEAGSPGGVTRITVFEETESDGPGRVALKPVAERLMFRRPVGALVLTYSYEGSHKVPFAPGAPVNLTIYANKDGRETTGAILWAAVVNETVFGQTDDGTARGLPAHFYICGEVEKPDDLEYADFLLTNHPRAAESLDLVLGTQGWRRFAEQAPGVFRKTAPPDEADRIMVAMGSRGPVPAEYRPLVQRVEDRYRPKYQQALALVEAAEQPVKVHSTSVEIDRVHYALALSTLAQIRKARGTSDEWTVARIPVAAALLVIAGVLAVCRYRLFRRGDPERRYLTVAALVAVALAAILPAVSLFETPVDQREAETELQTASDLGVDFPHFGPRTIQVIQPQTASPALPTSNPAVQIVESVKSAPGAVARSNPANSYPAGIGSPLESAAGNRSVLKSILADDPRAARLAQEFAATIEARLAKVLPKNPAGERVKETVSKLSPLIVREYAHLTPEPQIQAKGAFDATDTVLWQPVLIVPGTGIATVSFHLSGSTAGYRVLIAGHTLDGRVGTITGHLPVQAPASDPSR
jgi:hypothetical protein